MAYDELYEALKSAFLHWLKEIPGSESIGVMGIEFEENGKIVFFRTSSSYIITDWEDPIEISSDINLNNFEHRTDPAFFEELAAKLFSAIQTESTFQNLWIKKGFQFALGYNRSISTILDPLPGKKKPSFDVKKLVQFAKKSIHTFAEKHKDETFYAFAIDAGMLKMNSTQAFERDIKACKEKFSELYENQKQMDIHMYNPGNFIFKVADFTRDDNGRDITGKTGFNHYLYDLFYNSDDEGRRKSQYLKAMNKVLKSLQDEKVFDCLSVTKDFRLFVSISED